MVYIVTEIFESCIANFYVFSFKHKADMWSNWLVCVVN